MDHLDRSCLDRSRCVVSMSHRQGNGEEITYPCPCTSPFYRRPPVPGLHTAPLHVLARWCSPHLACLAELPAGAHNGRARSCTLIFSYAVRPSEAAHIWNPAPVPAALLHYHAPAAAQPHQDPTRSANDDTASPIDPLGPSTVPA